jgi:hypothetical protein
MTINLSMALQFLVVPCPLFQFRNPRHSQQDSLDRGAARRKARCTQTSIPRLGLEPTTTVFERAKAVHASDRAATVIGQM